MRVSQNSFVGGELDPALYGRQDLKKYFEGAARLSNFTVQRHGGVAKRAGTDLIADITTIAGVGTQTEGVRLIPFLFDRDTSYLIVLTHEKGYVFCNGAPVVEDGNLYNFETPYGYPDLAAIRYCQSGDTLFLTHSDYVPRTLVRYDETDWRLLAISFDDSVAVPTGLSATESAGLTGTGMTYGYCVSAVVNGQESRPSAAVSKTVKSPWTAGGTITLSWTVVDGAEEYRIYKKSYGSFGFVGSSRVTATPAITNTWTALSGTITATGYQNNVIANLYDGLVDQKTGTPSYHQSYYVFKKTTGGTLGLHCDLGEAVSVNGIRVALGAMTLLTGGSVSSVTPNIASMLVYYSDNDSDWTLAKTFTDLPDSVTDGALLRSFTSGSHRYWRVLFTYNNDSHPICLREVALVSSDTGASFVDDNISPDGSDAPTDSTDPWASGEGYPVMMTLYQQRSVWAGAPQADSEILFSSTGDLYSFNKSYPLKPDDAIDISLPLTKPGAIQHLVCMRDMIVLTESGEWLLTFDMNKGLSFDSLRMVQNSYYGCCSVVPIQTQASVLFVRRDARGVMEYQYQLANDGFQAADRSVLSAHMTQDATIVAWAYQQAPDSVIWCALSDGTMIALTYMPEHEIWAWSRHSLAGATVLDVVATGALVSVQQDNGLPGSTNTDEIYLLVRRGDQLFIERMRRMLGEDSPLCGDAVCMDCVQRVEAVEESTTIEPVEALPDGACTVVDLVTGVTQAGTVVGGVVTVATPVRYCLVGYTITSEIHTLRPELPQASLQAYRKTVKKAILRLRRFAGGTVGALGALTDEIAIPDSDPVITQSAEGKPDCTVVLASEDRQLPLHGMWNRDGQISLTHDDVWPFGLLCVMFELDVEGAS